MKLKIENVNNVNTKFTLNTIDDYDLQERANINEIDFFIPTKDVIDAIQNKKDIEYIDFSSDTKIVFKFTRTSTHNIKLNILIGMPIMECFYIKTDIDIYYFSTEFIEQGKTIIDITNYETKI